MERSLKSFYLRGERGEMSFAFLNRKKSMLVFCLLARGLWIQGREERWACVWQTTRAVMFFSEMLIYFKRNCFISICWKRWHERPSVMTSQNEDLKHLWEPCTSCGNDPYVSCLTSDRRFGEPIKRLRLGGWSWPVLWRTDLTDMGQRSQGRLITRLWTSSPTHLPLAT